MISNLPAKKRSWFTPQAYFPLWLWERMGTGLFNLLIISLIVVYLFPILYMISTSLMNGTQLGDRYAPPYPAAPVTYLYEDRERRVYYVPFEDGVRELALVKPGTRTSEFINPDNPEEGLITWEGSWRTLPGVYRFQLTWGNFSQLWEAIKFPLLIKNTLMLALISEIGVMISSIIVAYGFARFPLPGGDLLFYIMIATLLIPEKVTLIPTYFVFSKRVLGWEGTWLPILLPFFFGNAVYIFLLRQNFKSIPKEMEEAAMLDGAGPLRILFSVVLPQSWPVIITTALLHFFYIWNETRQAALYLSTRRDLIPVSFGVQNYQSLFPTQNLLQASALIVMIVPVVVILISQQYFMQKLVVTGLEK